MRSAFSSSYSALNNQGGECDENVYRSTTTTSRSEFERDVGGGGPEVEIRDGSGGRGKFSMVTSSVKRIFRSATANLSGSGGLRSSQSVFVLPNIREDTVMPLQVVPNISSGLNLNYERIQRLRDSKNSRRMPTTVSLEEAALLGTNPSEGMDEVELKNVQLSFPSARTLARGEGLAMEERVETTTGSLLVAIQGDRSKPAIVSYHDIGLNYVSNFQAFFNFVDMKLLLQNFCVYHVNAPGQEENAPTLPESFVYPTMDELADQILDVATHFGLKRFVGFGVGFGANVLCRFSLTHPDKMDALCVMNCVSTQAGWIEWGYQKMNTRNLKAKGMTQGVLDYLMWHHFGKVTEERNHDLVFVYRNYFESQVNPANLALLIDSYVRRTDLCILRELDEIKKKDTRTLKMPVLNITGALSPHVDDTVTFNGRLDPVNSTWMKIQDCGMVMEEQPGKLSEAFRLFLQGQGYALKLFGRKSSLPEVPYITSRKISQYRKSSIDSGAGSSIGSLNGTTSINNSFIVSKNNSGGASASGSSISTPHTPREDTASIPLINLSENDNNSSALNGNNLDNFRLEKGISDIRITENPISSSNGSPP